MRKEGALSVVMAMCRSIHICCLFVLVAVFCADGMFLTAKAGPEAAWQVMHERADDGSVTSTAYIDNDLGDRFSLTINAVKRQKVSAVKQGSLPYSYAREYKGKLTVDNETLWEGKMVAINPAIGDILILNLGFDWSDLLNALKKGQTLVIRYTSDIISEEIEFPLKGSAKAINNLLDKQDELAKEDSKKKEAKP